MENNAAIEPVSFTLPNGVVIEAKLHSDGADNLRGEWKSIDITATYPDGVVDVLCAVDWEDGRGTKSLVFEIGAGEPVYTQYYKEMDAKPAMNVPPVLRELSVRELADKICYLKDGEILKFYADKDENGGFDMYGASRVDTLEANHILFNYFGGSSPYVVDTTTAEDEVKVVEDALISYFEYCGIYAPVYFN